jgi:hypothetical protein
MNNSSVLTKFYGFLVSGAVWVYMMILLIYILN